MSCNYTNRASRASSRLEYRSTTAGWRKLFHVPKTIDADADRMRRTPLSSRWRQRRACLVRKRLSHSLFSSQDNDGIEQVVHEIKLCQWPFCNTWSRQSINRAVGRSTDNSCSRHSGKFRVFHHAEERASGSLTLFWHHFLGQQPRLKETGALRTEIMHKLCCCEAFYSCRSPVLANHEAQPSGIAAAASFL